MRVSCDSEHAQRTAVTACRAHSPRYRRLWRLPSVRVAGVAVAVTAAAAVVIGAFSPIGAAAVLVVGGFGLGGYGFARRAQISVEARIIRALIASCPACPGQVTVPGLTADVRAEVLSDGVTRIVASSWLDTVTALGYALGRDRGFQMDMLRRMATGELARVWGRIALPSDLTYRPLGLAAAATRAAAALDKPEADLLGAFAAGVNAAFERHGPPFECRFLSYRPRPWTAQDSLAIALLLFHSLSWNESAKRAQDITRRALPEAAARFFLPTAGGQDPPVPENLSGLRGPAIDSADLISVDQATAGSNCWVRAGGTGAPVLACDLHMQLAMPNLLYQVDLAWPGGTLRGLVAAGLPVVLTGSNGRLSWGVTNLGADVLDLVPVTGVGMAGPGGLTSSTERIRVRGRPDVQIQVTTHGTMPVSPVPLLSGQVAVRWAGHDPRACDLKMQRLAHASGVDEAIAVIDASQGCALNLLVADDGGRAAHLATGLIPRRPADAGPPEEFLTGAERPRKIDPPDGILVSANDAALPERSFRIGYDPDPGHRADRIRRLLAGAASSGPAMRAIQHDLAAGLYLTYRDLAVAALAGRDDGLASLLAGWDGTAAADSAAFGILVRLRQVLAHRVLSPYLSACRAHDPGYTYPFRSVDRPVLAILSRKDPSLLPLDAQADGWDAFVAGCAIQAFAELKAATGRSRVPTWGRLNQVGLSHPLAPLAPWAAALLGIAPRPQPGALHSVRTCVPGFGAVGRAVLRPGADPIAGFELPGGQSGHPLSAHFADRHREWLASTPEPIRPPLTRCRYLLTPTGAGSLHTAEPAAMADQPRMKEASS